MDWKEKGSEPQGALSLHGLRFQGGCLRVAIEEARLPQPLGHPLPHLRCEACKKATPWCYGGGDNELCDDCFAKRCEAAEA